MFFTLVAVGFRTKVIKLLKFKGCHFVSKQLFSSEEHPATVTFLERGSLYINPFTMLRNLLLTAYRSLKKNKFFSFLNIIGLGIGMAVFLLIALYVRFERSYEDFVGNS